jgi:hypothetical protein
MQELCAFPLVDSILSSQSDALGPDLPAYWNYVTRVLHFLFAIAPDLRCSKKPLLIALAFHDLGIWTAHTFGYLAPSSRLAHEYLSAHGLGHLSSEVDLIIQQHHKLRSCSGPFSVSVEAFRRADLVDLSLGVIRSGIEHAFIWSVLAAFPNERFHFRFIAFAGKQFLRTPLRPLPMVRW